MFGCSERQLPQILAMRENGKKTVFGNGKQTVPKTGKKRSPLKTGKKNGFWKRKTKLFEKTAKKRSADLAKTEKNGHP